MADGKVMHFYRLGNADDVATISDAIGSAISKCNADPYRIAEWLLSRFTISRNVPFILSNDIMDPQ